MKHGFKGKMIIFASAMMTVTCITLITLSVISSRMALQNQVTENLLSQGRSIRDQLVRHQDKLKRYAIQIAESRLVEGMFVSYEGGFYGAGFTPGSDQNIFSSTYQDLNNGFLDRAKRLAQDSDFKDLLLVASTGQIIFSLSESKNDDVYLGRQIDVGGYKGSKLQDCYLRAKSAKIAGSIIYSGYEVNPINKKNHALICMPKYAEFDHLADGIKKGDSMGVVILSIDTNIISQIANPKDGMGETGVGYIVGPDSKLRTAYKNSLHEISLEAGIMQNTGFESESVESAKNKKEIVQKIKNPFNEEVLSYSTLIPFIDTNYIIIV
ncbi:MAG TPA: cache domain-containing protein, partial [Pseudobdellovibrionaceae bacterium]|nr:cache domain-containing protein [Pseudobdellovibrionaceae bacterium]